MVQNGPVPFASDAIRTGGGTTLHWLGSTPRMLPNDFVLNSRYGLAVDWPFTYYDLKKYYELAELEIGVSGDVNAQEFPYIKDKKERERYYGSGYEFPMKEIPTSYLDQVIKKEIDHRVIIFDGGDIRYSTTIDIISTPQARNSIPVNTLKEISHIAANFIENSESKSFKYHLNIVKAETHLHTTIVGSLWDQYQGNRCEGNAACVPFCPVQAKYNALKTLKLVLYSKDERDINRRRTNVEVKAQHVVYKVGVDSNNKISHLFVKVYGKNTAMIDNNGNETFDLVVLGEKVINTSNAIVILAANAIENVKILLNSPTPKFSSIHPKVVGNGSDQLGRNLMDHMVLLTWTKTKEPIYPYRGPGSTSNISTFRDGDFRMEFSAWIAPLDNGGWSWPTGSPISDLKNFIADDSLINKINNGTIDKCQDEDLEDNTVISGIYGEELKAKMGDLLSKQLLFHWEVEQLPNPDNRVTIDKNYVDAMGIPRPVINYNISDYEKKGMIAAKKASDEIIKSMGLKDYTNYSSNLNSFVYNNQLYQYNGAGHIVGTHRMGKDPSNSVTNDYCKSWDHSNLYLIGTGCMPTLGTSNPTLTMSAITIRSAESVLEDLHNHFKNNKS